MIGPTTNDTGDAVFTPDAAPPHNANVAPRKGAKAWPACRMSHETS
jgi:hypothetical protein